MTQLLCRCPSAHNISLDATRTTLSGCPEHCISQSLLYSQQASDSLVICNEQELREAGAAIMAKRRTRLLGYSLLIMQSYAAKQASRRHQISRAHHHHRLHVQLEVFAAWRSFLQVRFPFVVVGSILALCHKHESTMSCVDVLLHHHGGLHLPYQSASQPVVSCFAD